MEETTPSPPFVRASLRRGAAAAGISFVLWGWMGAAEAAAQRENPQAFEGMGGAGMMILGVPVLAFGLLVALPLSVLAVTRTVEMSPRPEWARRSAWLLAGVPLSFVAILGAAWMLPGIARSTVGGIVLGFVPAGFAIASFVVASRARPGSVPARILGSDDAVDAPDEALMAAEKNVRRRIQVAAVLAALWCGLWWHMAWSVSSLSRRDPQTLNGMGGMGYLVYALVLIGVGAAVCVPALVWAIVGAGKLPARSDATRYSVRALVAVPFAVLGCSAILDLVRDRSGPDTPVLHPAWTLVYLLPLALALLALRWAPSTPART